VSTTTHGMKRTMPRERAAGEMAHMRATHEGAAGRRPGGGERDKQT
jgi:hypothetical protein